VRDFAVVTGAGAGHGVMDVGAGGEDVADEDVGKDTSADVVSVSCRQNNKRKCIQRKHTFTHITNIQKWLEIN